MLSIRTIYLGYNVRMELNRVDLNLLVALDALLAEQNVTRAAAKVQLSQPGMSSALGRLRKMFNDPLLVREGSTLVPTVRALSLVEPVRQALEIVEQALTDRPSFDAAVDSCHVRISCSDYSVLLLIGPLMHHLAAHAPGVSIEVLPRSDNPIQDLRNHATDLIIEPVEIMTNVPAPSRPLFVDRWLVCVSADNPRVGDTITLHNFLNLGHIVYSTEGGKTVSLADTYLAQARVSRRIDFTLESFLLAPYLLQGTELVTLVLERAVPMLQRLSDVRILEPPLDLPVINQTMWWSPSRATDPALAWVRQAIVHIAREMDVPVPGLGGHSRATGLGAGSAR